MTTDKVTNDVADVTYTLYKFMQEHCQQKEPSRSAFSILERFCQRRIDQIRQKEVATMLGFTFGENVLEDAIAKFKQDFTKAFMSYVHFANDLKHYSDRQ